MNTATKRIVIKMLKIKQQRNTFWDAFYDGILLNEYRYASAVVFSYPEAIESVRKADIFLLRLKKREKRKQIRNQISALKRFNPALVDMRERRNGLDFLTSGEETAGLISKLYPYSEYGDLAQKFLEQLYEFQIRQKDTEENILDLECRLLSDLEDIFYN